ncbi:MAG: 5-(carboxyamino)imidazole ribonucleotide synthase [Qipengyuania sp.]
MLKPGATIGILGGGQLGRMLAMAALPLGYRCIGYAPEGDNVAIDVCADFFANKWNDEAALAAFAAQCDVVTWEFENVPLAAVDALPKKRLNPARIALETAQDREHEKHFVEGLGGRPAPWARVESRADLEAAANRIGTPGILKTCRDGYDGKGQWRIRNDRDVEALSLPAARCVYEGLVQFDAEFSVVLVRGQEGEIRFWDSTRNEHDDGILARCFHPAGEHIEPQVEEARKLARQIAEKLGYVGVLTLEFFATPQGPVFNEMAPRVHNSGHWTIEGAVTSQFENHIRAICGLPLGDTRTLAPRIEMRNIIGKDVETAHDCLREPDAHLHLYGKARAREGRKMGHVTRLFGA